MGKYHERTFPGETNEYRAARDELLKAEMDLRQHVEDVAALRRKLPLGGIVPEDYEFEEIDLSSGQVNPVKLSELFGEGKDTLIVYGFMYGPDWEKPCPNCTSITDGSDGIAPHVRARTNFVTIAKASPEKLIKLARERGWENTRLLSSHNNTFNADYFAEYEGNHGDHHPMINVFTRKDGKIHHFWASELYFKFMENGAPRHADLIWPLWHFLDLTPEGRGDFNPKLEYATG